MNDLRQAAETTLFRLLGDENHGIQLRAAVALLQAPPKREWVGLTDKERADWHSMGLVGVEIVADHLKEKKGGN